MQKRASTTFSASMSFWFLNCCIRLNTYSTSPLIKISCKFLVNYTYKHTCTHTHELHHTSHLAQLCSLPPSQQTHTQTNAHTYTRLRTLSHPNLLSSTHTHIKCIHFSNTSTQIHLAKTSCTFRMVKRRQIWSQASSACLLYAYTTVCNCTCLKIFLCLVIPAHVFLPQRSARCFCRRRREFPQQQFVRIPRHP